MQKLNQKGITHIIAPIAFIGVFALIGGIVLLKSHAAGTYVRLTGLVETNGTTPQQYAYVIMKRPNGTLYTTYTNAQGIYHIPYGQTPPLSDYLKVGNTYSVGVKKQINGKMYCGGPTRFVASPNTTGYNQENFLYISPSKCPLNL